MTLDPEVDGAYPRRWIGKVVVRTRDGRELRGRVDEPKGDPGNTLSRAEIEAKFARLVEHGRAARQDEVTELVARAWALDDDAPVGPLLEAPLLAD